jgi:hypothetical protein
MRNLSQPATSGWDVRFPMSYHPRLVATAFVFAGFLANAASAKTFRVTVAAASSDRAAQVISFPLPGEAKGLGFLRDAKGAILPIQVDGDGIARAVIPAQSAGEALSFTLTEGKEIVSGVDVSNETKQLVVRVGGAPAFAYQMDKDSVPRPDIKPEYKRAGYLHPVYSPAGKVVTGDYHPGREHHHGIWSPWTKTSFQGRTPDFWNMHQKKGAVEFVGLDWTWSGPVHGGFVARHRMIDTTPPKPVTALHETWEVTAYNVPEARVFDVLLTQVCATNDPLILPEFHYGGMGLRGSSEWLGREKPAILTADGITDRAKAHTNKVRWLHIGGTVEGTLTGIAMMGHPENFRAPQPIRVGEGEPFFCFAPSQGGDWKIEPGKPYVARYRYVVADGAPDRARLDAFWNGYALPAAVMVEELP